MKKLIYIPFVFMFLAVLSACSAEETVAGPANDKDAYQRRIDAIMATDFTTLFSYADAADAKANMPGTINRITKNTRHHIGVSKGCTDAFIKIIIEGGKGKIWAQHFVDAANGKMVESACKRSGSHTMVVDSAHEYPAIYNSITKNMADKYTKLGSYGDAAGVAAVNSYIDKKLSTANGSAEFYIQVNSDTVEIYAPDTL